ncbi:hypothetical protein C2S51_017422 [Perilla frutescens var. frutescens]|nr:hypothetical protein C2S51_017422 [Perilla frutescens var. frutescens]
MLNALRLQASNPAVVRSNCDGSDGVVSSPRCLNLRLPPAVSLLSLFFPSTMRHPSPSFPRNSPPPLDLPLSGLSLTATFNSSVSPPAPYSLSL